jgi:hypothetical protein
MNDHSDDLQTLQRNLFGDEPTRSLLDQLLEDSRLYKSSKDYKALLDFVVQLRNFAPFNAMLLQVQKPGLTYAASARDWQERFGRHPKAEARPLLILWPFGPVALVYDAQDTEGEDLPEDVSSFVARGPIDQSTLQGLHLKLKRKNIELDWFDAGDGKAGFVRVVRRAADDREVTQYCIKLNRNHSAPAQFATLAHELGHLALGHLGSDKKLNVPERAGLSHPQEELEAESVAYVVCERQNVRPRSQTYLSRFVDSNTTVEDLDVYQIMRAAGQVEAMLGLTSHTRFGRPVAKAQDRADAANRQDFRCH